MSVKDFIEGNKIFTQTRFKKYEEKFLDLVKRGQRPKVLFITCSDSRVLPHLITNAGLGELFIVRNIGGFVAPYKPDEDYHSTAAAIEYAVSVLGVSDVIVCGHSHCGAIDALFEDLSGADLIHVRKWLDLGKKAKDYVLSNATAADLSHQERLEMTEKMSVVFSLLNLLSYPKIQEMVSAGAINLRGWYYIIQTGEIIYYNEDLKEFLPMGELGN